MKPCARPGCRRPAQRGRRGYCESHYRHLVRIGVYGYRDPEPARAHVLALRRLGWTWAQIADAAGTSVYVPHRLGIGRTKSLWVASEQALLAVGLQPRGSHRGTDNTGTRRRVQALARMAWPAEEVARRAGTTKQSLQSLILPGRRISHDLALRVAAVYDELCMREGPSAMAAAKARAAGHAPPLAWDDDLIDLTEADLAAELRRRAAAMDDAECARCHHAHYGHGDPSPLVAAAAREYSRRHSKRGRAAREAA